MTPNRPKSAKKSGSRKSSAGAMQTRLPQDPRSSFSLLSKHKIWTAAALAAVIVVAIGLGYQLLNGSTRNAASASAATFVGSETCAGCHRAEAELWRASQHKHAMEHATDKSVLGDFNDASFDYYGVHSRFFRKDGKFLVETDGPDGKLATFEVKYTFGVDPLQQYLVEFPDGRLQALSLAWDSRPKDKGGQRWFHLYPNEEIRHDDVLHWTKLNQNWNFMCAECHSTGVRKNYDAANDRFATTWAEISVGCEACHGQGSRARRLGAATAKLVAVRQARGSEQGTAGPLRRARATSPGRSIRRPATRSATSRRATLRKEVETCGLCHARRGEFSEDWVPGPLAVRHPRGLAARPRALSRRRADARRGLQLRLVQAEQDVRGRRHLQRLPRAAQREASRARRRRLPAMPRRRQIRGGAHHRHAGGRARALACASCHMPARTYMVVDRRHDHSFRIPRPDLSVKLGTPNACNDCHADKPPAMGGGGDRGLASGRAGRACRTMPRRSMPRGRTRRMRPRCLRPWRRTATRRRSRARAR